MKLKVSLVFLVFLKFGSIEANEKEQHEKEPPGFFDSAVEYVKDFGRGVGSMYSAYSDMRDANTIGADKYFHARGNYDAQDHGTGGRHAAQIISYGREAFNLADPRRQEPDSTYSASGGNRWQDSVDDMRANRHGWRGGDPNVYRPEGLDEKYR